VIETVGKASWGHSLKALRPGGTVIVSGATSGPDPSADLNRIFFLQLRVQGSTMGTREELAALAELVVASGVRPRVDRILRLEAAADGLAALEAGEVLGKVVLTP